MQIEQTQSPEDLLLVGEAASILQIHRDTLRRWETAGHITAQRTPTGHRRYRRADVQALLDNDSASAVSS